MASPHSGPSASGVGGASSAAANSVPTLPAGPAVPQSRTSDFVSKLIQPNAFAATRKSSLFRLMNPELFLERTAKVSPSAWIVTAMVGFAVVTIGYTQWEYTQTTQKSVEAAAKAKADAREQRKTRIRQELDLQEGRMQAR